LLNPTIQIQLSGRPVKFVFGFLAFAKKHIAFLLLILFINLIFAAVTVSNPTVQLNPHYIAFGVDFADSEGAGWGEETSIRHKFPQHSISISN
jgi:hypothetical protein